MKHEQYITIASSCMMEYSFTSTGPNGDKAKLIQYTYLEHENVCNLGFGVILPDGTIDDLIITNNGDMEKVLATVAHTVYSFTDSYPDIPIAAKGSTPSRTRLYRKLITLNYLEIEQDFSIYGKKNNSWELFVKGEDYEAFLVKRKKDGNFVTELETDKHEE
ncbi:MAG: hypothetical protein K0S32_2622 [Bacteroidetes bacterium]|jgi:hypothetical protein|nr:hypothetical protein [Bacteroidota bacterium]